MKQSDLDELHQHQEALIVAANKAVDGPLNLEAIKILGEWLDWITIDGNSSTLDPSVVRKLISAWLTTASKPDRRAASSFSFAVHDLNEMWLNRHIKPIACHLH